MESKPILLRLVRAVLVIGCIWYAYSWWTESNTVSLSEFNRDISTETVTHLSLLGDGRTIEYTVNNETKSVVSSGDPSALISTLSTKGVPVYVEPPDNQTRLIIISSIIPVLLLIIAMVWIAKSNEKKMGNFGKSTAKKIDARDICVNFDSVALSPEDKTEIQELTDFLKNSEAYRKVNAKIPTGILLSGPPGTGKTLVCKAIAKEANVPFFSVSGSEFDEMLVGTGASRIRDLFNEAKKENTAIIFIDEIDAIGQRRNMKMGNNSGDQTLNQLLTVMDGFESTNVIVIGATNRPDTLDPALLRPGRFDRVVNLSLPDLETRMNIIRIHLKNVVHSITDEVVECMAKGTPGFSGADLANMINEGAIFAARDQRSCVTVDDLDKAKDKVMMGTESPRKMKKEDLKLTAYHEAGHAIAGYLSPGHDKVYKVSIIPRNKALGVTQFLPDGEKYSLSESEIYSKIVTLLAGRAAEELLVGDDHITTGASNDLHQATELCRNMVTKWGMGSFGLVRYDIHPSGLGKDYSEETAKRIDDKIDSILRRSYFHALELLKEHRSKLDHMASELMEHETIGELEITKIMETNNEVQ